MDSVTMTETDSPDNGGNEGHVPLAIRRSRVWPVDVKRRIVEETFAPGTSVPVVARRHDLNSNLVFEWRKLYREGRLGNGNPPPRSALPGPELVRVGVFDESGALRPLAGTSSGILSSPAHCDGHHQPAGAGVAAHRAAPAAAESRVSPLSGLIEIELPNRVRIRMDACIDEVVLRRVLAAVGASA
jgi:hypothetical protein